MDDVNQAEGRAGNFMSVINLFFSRRGRISRGRFWLACLGAWAGFWAAYTLLDGIGPLDLTRLPAVILLGSLFCLCSRRYHDLNRSSLWLLLLLIPLAGLAVVVAELGFRRGTRGENSFGIDPRDLQQRSRDYATVA